MGQGAKGRVEGLSPSAGAFKVVVGSLREEVATAADAGCELVELLFEEPGWLGEVTRRMAYPPIGDFIPGSKDVLPLPLPAGSSGGKRGGLDSSIHPSGGSHCVLRVM